MRDISCSESPFFSLRFSSYRAEDLHGDMRYNRVGCYIDAGNASSKGVGHGVHTISFAVDY